MFRLQSKGKRNKNNAENSKPTGNIPKKLQNPHKNESKSTFCNIRSLRTEHAFHRGQILHTLHKFFSHCTNGVFLTYKIHLDV